ncbi:hypothetical protein [Anatilimnocola aggregata]|uniref:hypothetical protein n=1 Tax=Anatilimnocola aggregata TaxID=2528021 RepID=UPI00192E5356|nr:hypothetical protein [Anatilimnocola aggregata]
MTDFMGQPNVSMKMAFAHFGKTEPTIRKALNFAKTEANQTDSTQHDPQVNDQSDAA